jgi:hypothetical protein
VDVTTISAAAGATLGASGIIVALDQEGRARLAGVFKNLPYVLLSLSFLGGFWWVRANNYHLFSQLHCDLSAEAWRLSSVPSITFLKPLLLDILVVVGGFILKVIIVLGAAPAALVGLVFGVPMLARLLALPFFALPKVVQGIGVLLTFPFIVGRAIFYFFTEPPALHKLKRATRARDARPEEFAEAVADFKEKSKEELRADSWKESAVYRAWAYHYNKFAATLFARRAQAKAAYMRSINLVADALREEITERHRAQRRGRNGQQD